MLSSRRVTVCCFAMLLACLLPIASSLKCYVCDEADNGYEGNCQHKLQPNQIVDCELNKLKMPPTGCSTVFLRDINPIFNTTQYNVQRSCYYGNIEKPEFTKHYGCDGTVLHNHVPLNCTVCTQDLCNKEDLFLNGKNTKNSASIIFGLNSICNAMTLIFLSKLISTFY